MYSLTLSLGLPEFRFLVANLNKYIRNVNNAIEIKESSRLMFAKSNPYFKYEGETGEERRLSSKDTPTNNRINGELSTRPLK